MRRLIERLFPVFCLCTVVACAGSGNDASQIAERGGAFVEHLGVTDNVQMSKSVMPARVSAPERAEEPAPNLDVADQKIIREGGVRFETSGLKKTRVFLDSLIQRYEGYLVNDDQYKFDDRIEQRLVIRVPADNFDDMVHGLEGSVERFDSRTISARDVTEEFLDVSLRIQIKKETEQRYRDILTKATTVKDILEVERYIGRIRTEIESLEGRLKYLENRIAFSTLTVTFYQLKPEAVGFSSQFTVALKNGWNSFVLFVLGAVSLWPFILAGIILLLVLLFVAGRRKKAG